MTWTRRPLRRTRPRRPRASARPRVEALELRTLLSTSFGPTLLRPVAAVEPNDVLTQAQDLGTVDLVPAAVAGTVGDGPARAADVDWYQFDLAAPADVTLTTAGNPAGTLVAAVGLYEADPYRYTPAFTGLPLPPYGSPDGYHLLARAEGSAAQPAATVERQLAPGTYYVAVSGAGNDAFSPLLADSGRPGGTGTYRLTLAANDLPATLGPTVLGADPAPGAAVGHSPTLLRVNLSAPVAFPTVHLNQAPNTIPLDPFNDPAPTDPYGDPLPIPATVWLTYNPTGAFGDGNDQPVLLAAGDVSFASGELRLQPAAPLAPGYYQLTLAGDATQHDLVVTDLNGNPLGADADHPFGQDETLTFQVTGVEGQAAADDTPATAHELGDVTQVVQVSGTIGDNPDFAALPGADVDLYHFHLAGPGRYALDAEAFAGRVGSPLDVGLALFAVDPADGHTLRLVTANDNTFNGTVGADGFTAPLFTDAAVFAGLPAGDYYLAVSASGNVPDPAQGLAPGAGGVYDLNAGLPYTGSGPLTTGDYVLSVLARPAPAAPRVTATTPAEGSTLDAPPTHLGVTFSEPVDLQRLAYLSYQASVQDPAASPDALAAVFVRGADGTVYYPRLQSYDPATGRADFLVLDALPNGTYELHLSGALGLTDFADDPLVGNDPSGDYVVRFRVDGPPRGTDGNPLLWTAQPGNGPDQPQVLGPLFPHELQGAGVVLQGTLNPAGSPPAAEQDYQVELLQDGQTYAFNLSTADARVEVDDAAGNPVYMQSVLPGLYTAVLDAGTYRVRILDAAPDPGPVAYRLTVTLQAAAENPTPLTVGPEPSFRIRLATPAPDPGPQGNGGQPYGPPAPPRLTVSAPPPGLALTNVKLVGFAPPAGGPVAVTPAAAPGRGDRAETPASVLLALTAGPVGGVAAGPLSLAAAGSDGDFGGAPTRLLVRGPELVARDRLLQVAILTGIDGGGGAADTPPADPAGVRVEALVEAIATRAMQSWRDLIDFLFTPGRDGAALPVFPSGAGPDTLIEPAPEGPGPNESAPENLQGDVEDADGEPAGPVVMSRSGSPLPGVLLAACLVPVFWREPSERKRA